MHPLFWPRARAYARDAVVYLGVAAAMVPIGIPLSMAGIGRHRWAVVGVSSVPPLIAAVIAARAESNGRDDTWGKRAEHLTLRTVEGSRPTFGDALLRNLAKIAVPWQLGHVVAIGAVGGRFKTNDPLTLAATAVVYPLIGIQLWTCARGDGRGLHDRLAGTVVTQSSHPERPRQE